MPLPDNLQRRGSFPGPVAGSYYTLCDTHQDDITGDTYQAGFIIPCNSRIIRVLTWIGLTSVTDITCSIGWSEGGTDSPGSDIVAKMDNVLLADADWDAVKQADSTVHIGKTVISGDTQLAFNSAISRDMPRNATFAVEITSAAGLMTGPMGVTCVLYTKDHAALNIEDD